MLKCLRLCQTALFADFCSLIALLAGNPGDYTLEKHIFSSAGTCLALATGPCSTHILSQPLNFTPFCMPVPAAICSGSSFCSGMWSCLGSHVQAPAAVCLDASFVHSFVLAQKTLCARERTTKDAMDALVDAAIVCDEIAETGRLCYK